MTERGSIRGAPRSLSAMLAALCILATMSACTDTTGDPAGADPALTGSEAPEAEPDDASADLPSEFIRTAWRVVARDGARYVTYLDAGNRYRDFRNGDPWQEGRWETDSSDRLCFLPEAKGAVLRCWRPDRMQGEGVMIAASGDGRRIRLERADYSPPAVEDGEEGETGNEGGTAG